MSLLRAQISRIAGMRWTSAPAFVLGAALLLGGCSPSYDWREIRAEDDHYLAMMPGKPDALTLPIDLAGMKVSMTMRGARVGDVAFTVAATVLPEDSPTARQQAIDGMRTAMLRNIAGREVAAEAVAVPVVDAIGQATGSAPGWRMEAAGTAAGNEVGMHALFAAREDRAWQAVVVGPAPDREQARTFLDGFRITR
ncbi:MAG: hypothetical protein GX644_12900 [Limnobacter sp.]|nr:hypothetical protein [Limnobacter sp.]